MYKRVNEDEFKAFLKGKEYFVEEDEILKIDNVPINYHWFFKDSHSTAIIAILNIFSKKYSNEYRIEKIYQIIEEPKLKENDRNTLIDNIISSIVNRQIEPPNPCTADYLSGYAKCQNDIIDIIRDFMEE